MHLWLLEERNLEIGNLKFLQICMYWGNSIQVPLIADTINPNRYFKFRSNLHVVNQRKSVPENSN